MERFDHSPQLLHLSLFLCDNSASSLRLCGETQSHSSANRYMMWELLLENRSGEGQSSHHTSKLARDRITGSRFQSSRPPSRQGG
jgi:hypothetical protein